MLGVNSQPTSGERIIYLRYSKGLLKYKPSLTYLDKWFHIHPCTGNWQAICVVIGSFPAPILGLVCLLSHIIFHSTYDHINPSIIASHYNHRIHFVPHALSTFMLKSNLATYYIQKRRSQALLFSFEYNLSPNLISK